MRCRSHARAWRIRCAAAALLLAQTGPVCAVLYDVTDDPGYHTSAPTGALASSGWQFEGQFNGFLGTAIAPHYFLTARHIGGDTNTLFVLDGTDHHPTAWFDDPSPGSDLRLWHVAERLPRYAPTYTGTNEVGSTIAVFGRGTQRGTILVTDGRTNGWLWGSADGTMRWGSNRVEGIAFGAGAPYLYATFDHGAGPDECHLSTGDSGGAAFVLADGTWQLAGIHYAVDGPFNTTNSGGGFNAALDDAAGLYYKNGATWELITNHVASGFYSSRVSAHYAWLTNIIPDFDSDANGLPDGWEQQYAGGIHALSPTNDLDADGSNNLAEWIARTDPTNPASVFRTEALACTGNLATVTFTGWSNRLYSVYSCDALPANSNWNVASTRAFPGADGPTTWTDTNLTAAVTARFYRVEVALPP